MARGLNASAAVAARAAAMPITLSMRWMRHGLGASQPEIPATRWSASMISKVLLDDFFFLTEITSATFVSLGHRHRLANEISEALEMWERRGWLADPVAYHDAPPPLTETSASEVKSRFDAYRHLRFESLYAPHEGEPGGRRWDSFEPNKLAHAWLYEHAGPPRPWVICIPGYRMGHPLVDYVAFGIRWLHHALGLNIAVPVLPLHGPRSVGRRGGDGFLSGDFVDTVHAQAQAVWDTRRLIGWLRSRGAERIATYGVSLGGYTTALLACLERDIDCTIIGIPATDFVGLLEGHMPALAIDMAARLGFPFESLRRLLRVVSPLSMPPLVAHDRRFMYAATRDGLAVPSQARDLWRHWDRPRLDWYEGSHVSFLWESKVRGLVGEALRAGGLVPRAELT